MTPRGNGAQFPTKAAGGVSQEWEVYPERKQDLESRISVKTGEKLKLKKVVRSQKTGMLLPKEGTLVYITENLGRRLLLVAFDDGKCEYLFDDEVECATFDTWVRV
jgi:hypothetical protein